MKIGKNWKKLEKIGKNGSLKKMWFLKDVVPPADFMCFNFVVHERRNGGSEIGGKLVKMGENGWKWVKMGENGRKWVKIGWKLVKIENFTFMHFWWFFAILGDFRQFWFISCNSLKVSCNFLKETGNLLKEQTVWSCCQNWLFFLYY